MSDLVLHLRSCYFREVAAGTKTEEFRLPTPYWKKRLINRCIDRVVIWDAYKPRSPETVLEFPWRGVVPRVITHEHFGHEPVVVFAIQLEQNQKETRIK